MNDDLSVLVQYLTHKLNENLNNYQLSIRVTSSFLAYLEDIWEGKFVSIDDKLVIPDTAIIMYAIGRALSWEEFLSSPNDITGDITQHWLDSELTRLVNSTFNEDLTQITFSLDDDGVYSATKQSYITYPELDMIASVIFQSGRMEITDIQPKITSSFDESKYRWVKPNSWGIIGCDSKLSMNRDIEVIGSTDNLVINIKVVQKQFSHIAYVTVWQNDKQIDSFFVKELKEFVSKQSCAIRALYIIAMLHKDLSGHLKVICTEHLPYTWDDIPKVDKDKLRVVTTLFPVYEFVHRTKMVVYKSQIKRREIMPKSTYSDLSKICLVETNIGTVAITLHSILRYIERVARWLGKYYTNPFKSLSTLLSETNWTVATKSDLAHHSISYLSDTTVIMSPDSELAIALVKNQGTHLFKGSNTMYCTTIMVKGYEESCDVLSNVTFTSLMNSTQSEKLGERYTKLLDK